MSERKRVYRDEHGIRRTMIWDDEEPDQFHVLTEQDVEPVLDLVAKDRETMAMSGDNQVLGHFPAHVWERACHEQWDEGDWRRYLNSYEADPYRVWRGRV